MGKQNNKQTSNSFLTSFRATPFHHGKHSYVVVIPKSKFTEKILEVKEYEFSVKEPQKEVQQ